MAAVGKKKAKSNTQRANHEVIGNAPPWAPPARIVVMFSMSIRVLSAMLSIIDDCDEVYNYWEPTHYIVHGTGFQTWEYSPIYALRSYFYLLYAAGPAWILHFLGAQKVPTFYFMRMIFGLLCCLCEAKLYVALKETVGARIARACAVMMALNAGTFHASVAFLPSSFAMYCVMLAYAFHLEGRTRLAVFFSGMAGLWAWPFALVAALPIAVEIIARSGPVRFTTHVIVCGTWLVVPMAIFDSYMYGTFVLAPWNILSYNVFSSAGSHLYGTAPVSYYINNLLLNFNVLVPLALLAPIVAATLGMYKGVFSVTCAPVLFVVFFSTLPHKEERFLYPVYPLLVCSAVFCGFCVRSALQYTTKAVAWFARALFIAILVVSVVLSCARVAAQHIHYGAAVTTYEGLYIADFRGDVADIRHEAGHATPNVRYSVCVGDDWYRFPSSFFLPKNATLNFVGGSFGGQLPQPYASADEGGTAAIRHNFNELNLREADRYVKLESCDFVVDVIDASERSSVFGLAKVQTVRQRTRSRVHSIGGEDTPGASTTAPKADVLDTEGVKFEGEEVDVLEFEAAGEIWQVWHHRPFLDAGSSSSLCRALYIPYLSERHCKYGEMRVLLRKGRHANATDILGHSGNADTQQ